MASSTVFRGLSIEEYKRLISLNIRRRMKELGLNASAVAKAAGVTPAMVGRWIDRKACPTPYSYAKLCRGLDVDGSYLITKRKYKSKKKQVAPAPKGLFLEDEKIDNEARRILNSLDGIYIEDSLTILGTCILNVLDVQKVAGTIKQEMLNQCIANIQETAGPLFATGA